MFSRFEKITFALMVALLIAGVSILAASAQEVTPPADEEKTCADCHEEFHDGWLTGAHGMATADPVFSNAWAEQGNPTACLTCHVTGYDNTTGNWVEEGVSCLACHVDEGGDHPKTTMSMDVNGETCGNCHTDTRFGTAEWAESAHFASGMDCTNCHDPHTATVKITKNLTDPSAMQDESQLCITCHKDLNSNFSHSAHNTEGVTCVDCHVSNVETEIHQVADHSFKATIDNCSECHAEQMHTAGEPAQPTATTAAADPTSTPDPVAAANSGSGNSPTPTDSPSPVSPLGYAGITALIGIAAGMLLAPWLERGYRIVLKKSNEVRHEK
ncbi:MAG: hypothetical protein H6635_07340 [Anaerolineales bacterium]|nr:hypothetical protein [Anaerolineales bacterium]MCB9145164.1 hypothetical protein [Anaerolineales bacterium]